MRLYSRLGATFIGHQDSTYEADENSGAFEFPDHVGRELLKYHVGGKPMWETETGLRARLHQEELERRRDPASLFNAVDQLVGHARQTASNSEVEALKAQVTELQALLADKTASSRRKTTAAKTDG